MENTPSIKFYWRPGCPFCSGLERKLTKESIPFTKHNIWENSEDAAFVRSVANGNETVPTVKVGNIARVNPSIREIKKILNETAS